ncbi:hypothetical protein ROTAS13_02870 [Roseomonas sp. TAS13]|nr:hypothetical protein ROTAS13_02870 [Roseomonas sp. TAS13]
MAAPVLGGAGLEEPLLLPWPVRRHGPLRPRDRAAGGGGHPGRCRADGDASAHQRAGDGQGESGRARHPAGGTVGPRPPERGARGERRGRGPAGRPVAECRGVRQTRHGAGGLRDAGGADLGHPAARCRDHHRPGRAAAELFPLPAGAPGQRRRPRLLQGAEHRFLAADLHRPAGREPGEWQPDRLPGPPDLLGGGTVPGLGARGHEPAVLRSPLCRSEDAQGYAHRPVARRRGPAAAASVASRRHTGHGPAGRHAAG